MAPVATLGIDLETFSSNDIKYGVYKYVDAPDFEILLCGFAFDDEPVEVLDLTKTGGQFPQWFIDALYDDRILKTAFNANFEMTCFRKYFPDMPTECWECSSILALYNSLPTGLANVAQILKLGEDKQKDARGKALINYFSKPCKPSLINGGRTRYYPKDAPDKWATYIEYNRQDVVVERAIRHKLLRYKPSETEHKYWLLDQWINGNGARINQTLVNNAISMSSEYKARLTEEARRLTGLPNPNSVIQLKGWVEKRLKRPLRGLAKQDIADLLATPLDETTARVLRIRQLLGKTSVQKYKAMQEAVTSDGRVHGMFQFYGAMRTGRWAGRIVQLHNLPRNNMEAEELDSARNLVLANDLDGLELCFENVPDTLSQLVRTAIIPADGSRFLVQDFSAIEARVISWLSHEEWRREVFAKNGDIYCASASSMFKVPVEKHGINGHLRAKGKIAELALGYQGSIGALKAMGADRMGLKDDELQDIVKKWRASSPHIPQLWANVEACAFNAVLQLRGAKSGYRPCTLDADPKLAVVVERLSHVRPETIGRYKDLIHNAGLDDKKHLIIGALTNLRRVAQLNMGFKEEHPRPWFLPGSPSIGFQCRDDRLLVKLPSGRLLIYLHPLIERNRFDRDALTYEGLEQTTRKWGRLETYGGKLVENITQACARDSLAAAMLRLKEAGYKILMHVHDEVIMERPEEEGSLEEVKRLMCMNEPWEWGLIKNSDGFEGYYYMKD